MCMIFNVSLENLKIDVFHIISYACITVRQSCVRIAIYLNISLFKKNEIFLLNQYYTFLTNIYDNYSLLFQYILKVHSALIFFSFFYHFESEIVS